VHQLAYDDYVRALEIDPNEARALAGLVRTAAITKRSAAALGAIHLKPDTPGEARQIAMSKLMAAAGDRDGAIAAAGAVRSAEGLEQLASLFADSADTVRLDAAVAELRTIAPAGPATEYYAAVAAFLHGNPDDAITHARKAIDRDPNYAPTYDLIGAAYTKLGQLDPAREAFKKSLSFDPHDSTAYENLGIVELQAGNRALAARYFAEALWLVPESQLARQGVALSRP
jgi:Flp pilus assembly protein TadD